MKSWACVSGTYMPIYIGVTDVTFAWLYVPLQTCVAMRTFRRLSIAMVAVFFLVLLPVAVLCAGKCDLLLRVKLWIVLLCSSQQNYSTELFFCILCHSPILFTHCIGVGTNVAEKRRRTKEKRKGNELTCFADSKNKRDWTWLATLLHYTVVEG